MENGECACTSSNDSAKMKVRFIHSPGWMVLFGFVARLLYIVIAHSYRLSFAYWSKFEMANLAYSLASGHGFTGPRLRTYVRSQPYVTGITDPPCGLDG
jgi:hypothetical protein